MVREGLNRKKDKFGLCPKLGGGGRLGSSPNYLFYFAHGLKNNLMKKDQWLLGVTQGSYWITQGLSWVTQGSSWVTH